MRKLKGMEEDHVQWSKLMRELEGMASGTMFSEQNTYVFSGGAI